MIWYRVRVCSTVCSDGWSGWGWRWVLVGPCALVIIGIWELLLCFGFFSCLSIICSTYFFIIIIYGNIFENYLRVLSPHLLEALTFASLLCALAFVTSSSRTALWFFKTGKGCLHVLWTWNHIKIVEILQTWYKAMTFEVFP